VVLQRVRLAFECEQERQQGFKRMDMTLLYVLANGRKSFRQAYLS
jgi:hypothetical protein